MNVWYADYRDLAARSHTFESLEAVSMVPGVMSDTDHPAERFRMGRISAGLFGMLHVAPALGRGLVADDDDPGAALVVLLGSGIWKTRYGSDADVVGRIVRVNDQPATIVGVMPDGFMFPNQEQMWIPFVPTAAEQQDRGIRPLQIVGMLKPRASMADAAADLNGVERGLAADYPKTHERLSVRVDTFNQWFNGGPIRLVFLLMMVAVGFVLLIACANVANLMLSRALARQREVTIRTALGASRWRIVRQLLVESVVLSTLGGLFGLGLALLGIRAFDAAVATVGKPYWIDFSMDYRVFVYFAAICVASGVLFGLAPALRTSRSDVHAIIKDGARAVGSRQSTWLSGSLVVVQFTLAVVLLAGAGLFMRMFLAAQQMNAWMPSGQILQALVELPADRYPDRDARTRFFDAVLERAAALPGVERAALTTNSPGYGSRTRRVEVDGAPAVPVDQRPEAGSVTVSRGYFQVIDLPIRQGRGLEAVDGLAGHEAAVVTPEFATKFWPDGSAVGQRFRFVEDAGPGPWTTVVGVTGSIVQDQNRVTQMPVAFLSYREDEPTFVTFMLRAAGDPTALAGPLRSAVRTVDDRLPLFTVSTLTAVHHDQNWPYRVFGTVFFVFAIVALAMAAVGIYAVVAQSTSRRTREIGVRMALGATAGGILSMVLARGAWQLGTGLVLGLAAAFATTRVLKSLLPLVSPTDPIVFGGAALLLVTVGVFACWLPARRAAALNPVQALREE